MSKQKRNLTLWWILPTMILIFLSACQEQPNMEVKPIRTIELDPNQIATQAEAIKNSVVAEVHKDLELSLWATDSLVFDPIAIDVDDRGNVYYTRDVRLKNSEFDVRGHMDWATASIGFQDVEDRRAFLKETFSPELSEENSWLEDLNGDSSHDWRDLEVEKDQVWRVEDRDGDGMAEFAQLYIEDFHEAVTDVTNGVLVKDDEVFITQAPDVWRLKDLNGDGAADHQTSIAHGFGVHIGFSGHGMSGITMGPDGRIYWGIGDIGMNVVDQTGKRWKYPNQGVICRANPDGSDFEVYAAGLRNTHEFVFDAYGNIISEDNDGDHRGERERLVYIVNGHDAGWRINWQFGKYTDPDNNGYKVWMDEKLHIPRWEDQAAYIIPPIMNYHNGPTGMVYNPGTGLSPEWKDHFFLVEFVGSPSRATINAFQLKPKGAGFEFAGEQQVLGGVLATGLEWGPDGSLIFSDWIDGWAPGDNGRIWKLDVPNGPQQAIRQQTMALIQEEFGYKTDDELSELLAFEDMRIRLKAQFELADRGRRGRSAFEGQLSNTESQFARIHSIWGIGQLIRQGNASADLLMPLLEDGDAEIIAQAAKTLGDIKYAPAESALVPLLAHENSRVRFFGAEALGRIGAKSAVQPLIEMLVDNNDEDVYLRHAGALALSRINEADPVVALKDHENRAVRIAAVVALRRMQNPGVAEFLNDEDEYIVTEAARAINDDWSIPEALPALAALLKTTPFQNEALIRRAINANLRVGEEEQLKTLADYAVREDVPEVLRAEAVATIGVWANPSPLDRVDGRFRGYVEREISAPQTVFASIAEPLLASKNPDIQAQTALAAGKLDIKSVGETLFDLIRLHSEPSVRVAALSSLSLLNTDQLTSALSMASEDQDRTVRVRALEIVSDQDLPIEEKAALFAQVLKSGSVQEQQTAILALGELESTNAVNTLNDLVAQLNQGRLNPGILLELEEAVKLQDDAKLTASWQAYESGIAEDDYVAQYMGALEGGNGRRGWWLFNSSETSQCTRCHVIQGEGSDVGPALEGVASRLSKRELLTALVDPSAQLAEGYAVETLTLNDGKTAAGFLVSEDNQSITLRLGDNPPETFEKANVKERVTAPSSMPTMRTLLTKSEIRDVVAFLSTLK